MQENTERSAPTDKSFLEKIKQVISRRSRSRSNSPSAVNRPPIIFSAGIINHPHSSSNPHETPYKYLLVNCSNTGTVLPLDSDSPNNLGYLICECPPEDQFRQINKNIVFISHPLSVPDPGPRGHFVSSAYVLPELTLAQSLTAKSWPLFYRLPLEFQYLEDLRDVNTEALIGGILKDLTGLSDSVGNKNVEQIYQTLFNTLIPLDSSTAHSPSLPGSPSYSSLVRNVDKEASSESESDGDGDDPLQGKPLHGKGRATQSKHDERQLGILIYGSPRLEGWCTPCSDHLALSTKKLIKNKAKKVLREGILGILLFANHKTSKLDFIEIDTYWLEHFDKSQYPSIKFRQTTFTLVATNSIVEQRRPKFSVELSQTLPWFRNMSAEILTNNLLRRCAYCSIEFISSETRKRHIYSVHANRSAKAKQNLQEKALSQSAINNLLSSSDGSNEDREQRLPRTPTVVNRPESILVNSVQIFTPKILNEPDTPKSYMEFWECRNFERPLTRSEPPNDRWVAPKFPLTLLSMEAYVNYPGLLEQEFINYAKCYHLLKIQKHRALVEGSGSYKVGVINDASHLTMLGKGKILEDLKRQAPQLEEKNLSILTESAVQTFFTQSRTYALSSSIPHDSWGDYYLTNAALGAEILSKVKEALAGFPTYKPILRNFSSFIEKTIITLLPAQESFYDTEQRMMEAHKSHLLGPSPNIDYTRTKIQTDSRELVTKSPQYKQIQAHITESEKRLLIEGTKINLLFKIIANTSYEAKLHQLLIASDKYSQLECVPYNVLLDNIQNLIIAERKSEIAYVNANKSPRSSRSSLKTPTRKPVSRSPSPRIQTRKASSDRRTSSRSKTPQRRSPSYTRPPSRSRSPATQSTLQDKCDSCLRMKYPEYFCHGAKHCRVRHHQPPIRDTDAFHRRMEARDKDLFIYFDKCGQCKQRKQERTDKTPWVQANNSTSQVAIPKNYFQQPFTLHPQSVTDIAQQLARMSGQHHSTGAPGPSNNPQYPTVPNSTPYGTPHHPMDYKGTRYQSPDNNHQGYGHGQFRQSGQPHK